MPLVLIDRHERESRIVDAGVHGILNLWLAVEDGPVTGRWEWPGRTSGIDGRRVAAP